MTKLYMHHFRGGLVYCCIVTHKKVLFLRKTISQKKCFDALFCALSTVCAFFLCLYHYLRRLICKLTFTEKRIYLPVFEVPASMCARCNIFPSMVPHFYMCRTVLLSVQHIDMNIQHQCTSRVTGEAQAIQQNWLLISKCENSRLQNKLQTLGSCLRAQKAAERIYLHNAASSIDYYINIFIQMAVLGTLFFLIDGSFGDFIFEFQM